MFATFDKREFPLIHIKLSGTINSDEEFEAFTREWISCDEMRKPYTFMFDSIDVGFVNIRYAVKTARFIQTLKAQINRVYLEKSIIVCSRTYIHYLLSFIFYLQKPVAPVYIVSSNEKAAELYIQLQNGLDLYGSDVSFIPTE